MLIGDSKKMYNDEKGTSILMVIVKKENLWKVVDSINERLNTKIIILKSGDEQYQDFFFVMFEAIADQLGKMNFNSTVVHKKGRCYYTINALNNIVYKQVGVVNKNHIIDWEKYQNSILFLDREDELIKVDTKIYRVIRKK